MNVPGGNEGSVGLAGVFGQGGGHGIYGPSYGLMVDNAVEFDIVTADGEQRTINAMQRSRSLLGYAWRRRRDVRRFNGLPIPTPSC